MAPVRPPLARSELGRLEVIGRRVASLDEIALAGDYFGPTDEIDASGNVVGKGVWFLLPIHEGKDKFDHATRGSGLHRVTEPPWTFRECDDGSLEIRESILSSDKDGEYFHGYLDEGHVWRQV